VSKKIKLANDVFLQEIPKANNGKWDGYVELIYTKKKYVFNIFIESGLSQAEKCLVLEHELEHLSQAMNYFNKEVFNEITASKMANIRIKAKMQYVPATTGSVELLSLKNPKRFLSAMSEKKKEELSILIKTIEIDDEKEEENDGK